MTFGTGKLFKSGTGLAMCISKHAVEEQNLVPGCVVEYDLKKLKNIEPKPSNHFKVPI